LVYRNSALIAIFPANESEQEIYTHQGVTFAGLIYPASLKSIEILFALDLIAGYYASLGFHKLHYFPVPFPFCRSPSQDDLYWLFRVNAQLYSRVISSILPMANSGCISKLRLRKIQRAEASSLVVKSIENLQDFYRLLSSTLSRHSVRPVHTLSELSFLLSHYPDHLILLGVFSGAEMLAGSLVFDFGDIVHTQYLASSKEGRGKGALDYLIYSLIQKFSRSRQYLSLGSSCESFGSVINTGLLFQKEGFGARSITLDKYSINLPVPSVMDT
jgi:hypothetical protein